MRHVIAVKYELAGAHNVLAMVKLTDVDDLDNVVADVKHFCASTRVATTVVGTQYNVRYNGVAVPVVTSKQ